MLERIREVWARRARSGPGSTGRRGLLVGGGVDASFARAARFGDGWIAGGSGPDVFAEAAEKVKSRVGEGRPRRRAAARRPRLLLARRRRRGRTPSAYLVDYYAWLGEEIAGCIAAGAAKDAETVEQLPRRLRGGRLRRADPLPGSSRPRAGRPARRRRGPLSQRPYGAADLPILRFAAPAELEAWLEREPRRVRTASG